MTKTTKTLLVLTVVNLIAGFLFASNLIDVRNVPVFYVALPAGAIFLGMFVISKLLEKEVAAYDAEQQKMLIAAHRPAPGQSSPVSSSAHQTFAKAH